jgi:hypothetical protein
MSLSFNKDILKEVYDEEISRFKISPGANNRIKQFLEDIMRITNDGRDRSSQQQLLQVANIMNTFTSADIVAYCLQLYYDEGDTSESLYSSGIERTSAYFDTIQCEPPHPTYIGESKPEYIETVMFRCFSNYVTKKGYRARDIYRFMIRFGCISNAMSSVNIIRQVFTLLSKNDYYLRSGNLDEGSEHGYTDRNILTGNGKIINLTSSLYSQITDRSYTDVGGQPFLLTIDYGNLDRLDAHPYAYVLPTLFYMRDNRVNDYEGTKRIVIREFLERQQEEIRLQEERRQQQHYANEWMKSRMQLGTQGGGSGRARKIKSKKSRKIKMNKKVHSSRNKSCKRRKNEKSIQ